MPSKGDFPMLCFLSNILCAWFFPACKNSLKWNPQICLWNAFFFWDRLSRELFRAYIILFDGWRLHFSEHILNSNSKRLQVCWVFPDPGNLSENCRTSGFSLALGVLQKHHWNFQNEPYACWSHWHDPGFPGVQESTFLNIQMTPALHLG